MRRSLLGEDTIVQRVAARVARQEIFLGKPLPTISFVVEEAVLRRPIVGWDLRRGQLEQIPLRGHQRNVEMQVMPLERSEHASLAGPFTLIEATEGRTIAYVEAHKESRLYSEREAVRELEEQSVQRRVRGRKGTRSFQRAVWQPVARLKSAFTGRPAHMPSTCAVAGPP